MTGTGFNRMAQTESHTPKHAAPKHAAKTPTSAPTFTPPTPSTGTEPKKGRKLWLIPLIIVAALAGIYLIGVAVFSSRFLPNTTVNGENVSLMSVSDVASTASKSLDGYSGTVSGDGISFTVSASDVGLTYDGTTFARDGIVFVSINYRVASEGFSVLEGAPLNLGVADAALAGRAAEAEDGEDAEEAIDMTRAAGFKAAPDGL